MMGIEDTRLELYWHEIPIGKENAWPYEMLCVAWMKNRRQVREILHELSRYDNGDDLILIRSSKGDGFYRTNDPDEIKSYRKECLSRGKRTLAPLRKIDRVMKPDDAQLNFENNLKAVRLSLGLKATEVCDRMKPLDPNFDGTLLSKMENGRCFPTPLQLAHLAGIYRCTPSDLINMDLYRSIV